MKKKEDIIFRAGKRVILRPLCKETDLRILTKFFNDPDNSQFILRREPMMLSAEAQWLDELPSRKDHYVLGIVLKKTGALIGTMGLGSIDWTARHGSTGAMIGEKKHRSCGYGSEAKMLMLDFAFNALNLRKVFSKVWDFNGRSLRYSEKCGYIEEARIKEFGFKNGAYCDEVILGVTRENWLPLWEKFKKTGRV